MRRLAIRLGSVLLVVLVASQFAIPAYLEHRVASRLTDHGGSARVELAAVPALQLLFGHGHNLDIRAQGLSVDLQQGQQGQQDVFSRLDAFDRVNVEVTGSRAGPFRIGSFRVRRSAPHTYLLAVAGDGTAGDVARYAGGQLAGGFGQALAGLAAAALGDSGRAIPFDASMQITDVGGTPRAANVTGDVAGLPAGPLAQIVANALLRSF
jgi:hypothetical protein